MVKDFRSSTKRHHAAERDVVEAEAQSRAEEAYVLASDCCVVGKWVIKACFCSKTIAGPANIDTIPGSTLRLKSRVIFCMSCIG